MLTRKNKNYKERNSFTLLSRFVLPLSVIMVLVLLFISIKMLIMPPVKPLPNKTGVIVEKAEPENSVTIMEAVPPIEESETVKNEVKDTSTGDDIILAQPVSKPGTSHTKKTVSKKNTTVKTNTTHKNTGKKPIKQVAKPSSNTRNTSRTSSRWDVQIGGFSSRNGASQVRNKAKNDGFDSYIVESTFKGKPFYKVRVRGNASKEKARTLSNTLSRKGYPVFLVNTSK